METSNEAKQNEENIKKKKLQKQGQNARHKAIKRKQREVGKAEKEEALNFFQGALSFEILNKKV